MRIALWAKRKGDGHAYAQLARKLLLLVERSPQLRELSLTIGIRVPALQADLCRVFPKLEHLHTLD
jgi:hypothetical protein